MQSETGFASSHQLKSYIAFNSRLKLAARAVLSADAGLLVTQLAVERPCIYLTNGRPFPSKLSLSVGDLNPHLIHGFLTQPESSTQTASPSVQPFLHGSSLCQNKNSSGDEIANVNFYAVRPEATRIR